MQIRIIEIQALLRGSMARASFIDRPVIVGRPARRTMGVLILTTIFFVAGTAAAENAKPSFEVQSFRGRVVWASDALSKQFGIHEVPEAAERVLVLREDSGKLHPLVEDVRGRAFRRDDRLRGVNVELLARKYRDSPFIQIIRVFELSKAGKFEIDYWCEICSIAMFELKECECCQGPIELRRRKVDAEGTK